MVEDVIVNVDDRSNGGRLTEIMEYSDESLR